MDDELEGGGLGTAIATTRDRRSAFVVMAALVGVSAVTSPWAGSRLGAIPVFVPMYDTAIMVLDILAAVLLYAQFEYLRWRSQLVLACAYVFTPLVIFAHALSIPNAFAPGILIGGQQTAAWLWTIWHAVFPAFIVVYSLLTSTDARPAPLPKAVSRRSGRAALVGTIALSLVVVMAIAGGESTMPSLMRGNVQNIGATRAVFGVMCFVHMTALGLLIHRTRLQRLVDLWLAVALVALASEIVLSGMLIESRYQAGYYLGRMFGLIGTLLVLGVLLREAVRLSAMASRLAVQASKANSAKDEFIAMLAHELRNPLAPIATAVQVMKLKAGDALSNERAVIERQARRMTRLVDDLLDVSLIARGKVELRRSTVDIGRAISDGIELAMPLIEQKHHALHIDVPTAGPCVDGDPDRLAQVFSNLLNNAAKYTPAGGELRISAHAEEQAVVIEIGDNGIGLSPADQQRVFDAFERVAQGEHRSVGGLGLGLAIVRSLVMLHGGSVRCRSEGPGAGSTFTVNLPLAACA